MTAVGELLQQNKIRLASTAPGRHYTTCPQCSAKRSAPHQKLEVLGVTIGPDGKVGWGCNHCGWTGPEKGNGQRQELQTYVYRDAGGVPRFRKVRNLSGRQPRFWLERSDGKGGWKTGTKGIDTSIIYRADEVRSAIAGGRTIALAEGEKDVDRLWSVGIPASCNVHGASEPGKKPKWTKAHSAQIAGADLVVFNDNDAPGYEHAYTACRLSVGVAKRVRRLDLAPHWPDIPVGGDVSDYLAAGHTPDQLAALIAAAPEYVLADSGSASEASAGEAPTNDDDDAELAKLARMSAFEYERARAAAAKALGVRAAMLDKLVTAKRAELGLDADDGRQGRAISLPEPEPWPEPVDGGDLLDGLASALCHHVILPPYAADAIALWVVHTHMAGRSLVSPRLALRSVTKQCGKTTTLDILVRLVHRPLPTVNVTAAAIFRIVEAHRPTLLIDEGDAFLNDNEELRGLINSGHRQGGCVLRIEGDSHEPRAFATYTPTAIAAIGSLPGTIMDRSIIVDLVRRKPDERIAPLRLGHTGHLDLLARRVARWAKDNGEAVAARDPEMPPGVHNRPADNWRPLLQIADQAGGLWPVRARSAALSAVPDIDEVSRIELLLGDVRGIFNERQVDRIAGAALIEELCKITPRPWSEYGRSGKPITANKLARLLKPLGIAPQVIRLVNETPRGYLRTQFNEAFERFLAPEGGFKPQQCNKVDGIRTSDTSQSATAGNVLHFETCEKPNSDGLCCTIAVGKGGIGQKPPARGSRSDDLPYVGPLMPVPDQGPDQLDEHGEPVARCAQCGEPGGNRVALDDGTEFRLHRDCEDPFIDRRLREEGVT